MTNDRPGKERVKLLNRVKRIRGQMDAVERTLAEDRDCALCARQYFDGVVGGLCEEPGLLCDRGLYGVADGFLYVPALCDDVYGRVPWYGGASASSS